MQEPEVIDPLVVRVSALPSSGKEFVHTFKENAVRELLAGYGGLKPTAPLQVKVFVMPMTAGFYAKGSAFFEATTSCKRCLDPVVVERALSIVSTFLPVSEAMDDEEEVELTANDVQLSFYRGDDTDLTELVRETIVLEIEENQLCDDECPGLCSSCGAHKGRETCSCPPTDIDPRWADLLDLKKN